MIKIVTAFLKTCLSIDRNRFVRKLKRPQLYQEILFKKIAKDLAHSYFGETLGVKSNDTYQQIAKKIPIQTYDKLDLWIDNNGVSKLFSDKIIKFQRTSGSSGANKDIPYTRKLLKTFNRMMKLWIADVLLNSPKFTTGRIFYSITPQGKNSSYAVEQAADTDYLSPILSMLFKKFCVVPRNVKKLQNTRDYLKAISILLLLEEDLEIISIWHPTLLEAILNYITANRFDLNDYLLSGQYKIQDAAFHLTPISSERLKSLHATPIDWQPLWPKLKFISCWDNGNARESSNRIKELFPWVFFQGKGLGATESPITVPLFKNNKQIPLLDSVFFEFLDKDDQIFLLHELELHKEYRLIIWPYGGFPRYRIGDLVRVSDFHESTPCLEFIGRENGVSDLVGEKLSESFVIEVLKDIPIAELPRPFIVMPTISKNTHLPCYLVVINSPVVSEKPLMNIIENKLCSSYQYSQARNLNQLGPLEIVEQSELQEKYFDFCLEHGMCLGDVKSPVLICSIEKAKDFLNYLDKNLSRVEVRVAN